jgi:signal transduction histidine kinase
MSGLRALIARHGTIRLRLALFFAVMFLVLGTVLIAVIVLVAHAGGNAQITALQTSTIGGAPAVPPVNLVGPAVNLLIAQQNADNGRLFAIAWIMVAVIALTSIPLGWFASGRMLRPLREITARARTISAGNLHERVALAGAHDEFTELGDTLDDLLARLEASFDAQRRFVANASHELRTPLTVDRLVLQVALADPNANAETLRATCEELLASGREQERLLEALLTLASSERGLERREPVDIEAIVALVLQTPRPEITQQGLTLTSDLRPAVAAGDPALIQRLISNLVDNAVRHNIPDGAVTVSSAEVDGQAVVTISNTGQMIGPGEVETMFEPFRRLGAQRTGSDTGQHGLGLSIVRAIALAHAATVTARPRTDGGLEMTVTFPQAQA